MEEDLKKYSEVLTIKLRDDLKNNGHYSSGKLDQSINVTLKVEGNGVALDFKALDYIKKLENGKFWTEWIKKQIPDINNIVAKAMQKDIIEDLKQQ